MVIMPREKEFFDMKFYLIHHPIAPDIERTMAEANATGHKWEAIERPSDHKGIVSLVKEIRASAMQAPELPMSAAPEAIKDDTPAPTVQTKIVYRDKPSTGPDPRTVEIMNATEGEDFIWKADADRIAKIRAVLEEREAELAKYAPVPADPPKRKRR